MKKTVIIIIILGLAIAGVIYAYMSYENNDSKALMIEAMPMDDKKIPGDSMTEKAIQNAQSGKPQMDQENLPANNKPKSNDIQGGVILEGSANEELKVNP